MPPETAAETATEKSPKPALPEAEKVKREEAIGTAIGAKTSAYEALDFDTYLNRLQMARETELSGQTPVDPSDPIYGYGIPSSAPEAAAYHARSMGLSEEDWRRQAADLGVSLDFFEEQVGRQGLDPAQAKQLAAERGISLFEPDEGERETKLRGEAIQASAIERYEKAGEPVPEELTGGHRPDFAVSEKEMGLMGAGISEEVSKPGEPGYLMAVDLTKRLQEDPTIVTSLNHWSQKQYGWYDYTRERGHNEAVARGYPPGSKDYEDHYNANLPRYLSEIAMYKTTGLWAPWVSVSFEYDDATGDLKVIPPDQMTFKQAAAPTFEVIGLNNDGQAIVRQASPLKHTFDIADYFQSGLAGVLQTALSEEGISSPDEAWTAAKQGIAERKVFLGLGMNADTGNKALDTTILLASGGATLFTPDLFMGASGALKLGRSSEALIKEGIVTKRATDLLGEIASARAAGDFKAAEAAEALYRAEFPNAADFLDVDDARVALRYGKENPDIVGKGAEALARELPEGAAETLIHAHPSVRKEASATKGVRTGQTLPQVGYEELYGTEALLKRVTDWQRKVAAKDPGVLVKDLRTEMRSTLAQLDNALGASYRDEMMAWVTDGVNLEKALRDPEAWMAEAQTFYRSIRDTKDGASDIHRLLGGIKAASRRLVTEKSEPLFAGYAQALARAEAAIRVNNETRAVAALLRRESLLDNNPLWRRVVKPLDELAPLRTKVPELPALSEEAITFANKLESELGLGRGEALTIAGTLHTTRAGMWARRTGRDAADWWKAYGPAIERVAQQGGAPAGWGAIEGATDLLATETRLAPEVYAQWTRATDAAEWLVQNARNPVHREIAQRIRVAVEHAAMETADIPTAGRYTYGQGRATLTLPRTGTSEETLLHELMHAATAERIRQAGQEGAEGARLVARLEELRQLSVAKLAELEAAGELSEQALAARRYGTKNLDEFIAEAFSDADFQALLRAIEITPTESLWTRFVNSIMDLLGLKGGTALEETFATVEELIALPLRRVEGGAVEGVLGAKPHSTRGAYEVFNPVTGETIRYVDTLEEAQKATAGTRLDYDKVVTSAAADAVPAPGPVGSPAFNRWFEGSKVLDRDGKPLVMWHGSGASEIDAFDTYGRHGLFGSGAYFTDSTVVAEGYAKTGVAKAEAAIRRARVRDAGPAAAVEESLYPVFLSIKNPIDMDAPADIARWVERARAQGYDDLAAEFTRGMTNEQAYRKLEQQIVDEGFSRDEGASFAREWLEDMGFDGITHIGGGRVADDGLRHRVFVAFEAPQIKSIWNKGTWDASDARILYSKAAAAPEAAKGTGNISRISNALEVELLEDGRTILRAFAEPTAKDVTRALGTVIRRELDPAEMKAVAAWLNESGIRVGVSGANFTGDAATVARAEERFAEAFEAYLLRAPAPNSRVEGVFRTMRQSLVDAYQRLNVTLPDLSVAPEVEKVFNRLLREEAAQRGNPLKTTLGILREKVLGVPGAKSQGFRATDAIAEAARRMGVDTSSDDLVDQLARSGSIVLPKQVQVQGLTNLGRVRPDGSVVLELRDIARVQAALGEEGAIARSLAPRESLVSPAHAFEEENAVETLISAAQGEGTLRGVARGALATFFGGDAWRDIRHLPPPVRHRIMAGERSVQQAVGECLTLIEDLDQARLLAYLSGDVVNFARSGRSVISSGIPAAEEAMRVVIRHVDAFDDNLRAGLQRVARAVEDGTWNVAEGAQVPHAFRNDQAAAEALERFWNAQRGAPEMAEHVTEALGLQFGGKSPELHGHITEILLYYAGRTERKGALFSGNRAEQAAGILADVEKIFGKEKSLHMATVLTAQGHAENVRRIWGQVGLAFDEQAVRNFQRWVNSMPLAESDMPKVMEMARRVGFNPHFFDDMALAGGYYLPKAARTRLEKAIARSRQLKDPVSVLLRSEDAVVGELAQRVYRYIKVRMTRGSIFFRPRYFTQNTFDHFTQMALAMGYGPALMSSVRVAAQDVMIHLPGFARGIELLQGIGRRVEKVAPGAGRFFPSERAHELIRQSLQQAGDRGAQLIGKMLGEGRWRIEVNPILEGAEGFFHIGGRVYSYQDIRRIAMEEGIFSSFDTSALERVMSAVRDADGRLILSYGDARGLGQSAREAWKLATNLSADTAEAWAERERIGAMVTLMELGLEPRSAARVVIDGLYDYAGSMSKGDRAVWLNLVLPFWAFQKNANRQIFNAMTSPWGSYRMGVLRRAQEMSADVLTELYYGSITDPYGVDVDNLPSDVAQNYWALRNAIEFGMGPLEDLDERTRHYIAQEYGPLESLDPETRRQLEEGYGGPDKVPEDVKQALRMIFAGQDQALSGGRVVSLDHILRKQRSLRSLSVENYTIPRPEKSYRRSYMRDRAGIALPARRTEAVVQWMNTAQYEDPTAAPYMEVFYPESTIHAGMRWNATLAAFYILAADSLTSVGDSEEPADIYARTPALVNTLTGVVDVESAPIPGAVMASMQMGNGSPRRIHPALVGFMDTTFPGTVRKVSGLEDPFSDTPPVREDRYYVPVGLMTIAFDNSPLGELNNAFLSRAHRSGLEQAMAPNMLDPTQGDFTAWMLGWARGVFQVQTAEQSANRAARSEETRRRTTTSTPPTR